MKYVALLLLSSFLVSQSFQAVAQQHKELPVEGLTVVYELPDEPTTPVVTMNILGGNLPGTPLTEAPTLSILADGTILLPAKWEGKQAIDGKMSNVELQELLDFIITRHSFFSYDANIVKEKIVKADVMGSDSIRLGSSPPLTMEIHVTANGRTHAVSTKSRRHTWGIKELESIAAIFNRLYQLEWNLRHPPKVDVGTPQVHDPTSSHNSLL